MGKVKFEGKNVSTKEIQIVKKVTLDEDEKIMVKNEKNSSSTQGHKVKGNKRGKKNMVAKECQTELRILPKRSKKITALMTSTVDKVDIGMTRSRQHIFEKKKPAITTVQKKLTKRSVKKQLFSEGDTLEEITKATRQNKNQLKDIETLKLSKIVEDTKVEQATVCVVADSSSTKKKHAPRKRSKAKQVSDMHDSYQGAITLNEITAHSPMIITGKKSTKSMAKQKACKQIVKSTDKLKKMSRKTRNAKHDSDSTVIEQTFTLPIQNISCKKGHGTETQKNDHVTFKLNDKAGNTVVKETKSRKRCVMKQVPIRVSAACADKVTDSTQVFEDQIQSSNIQSANKKIKHSKRTGKEKQDSSQASTNAAEVTSFEGGPVDIKKTSCKQITANKKAVSQLKVNARNTDCTSQQATSPNKTACSESIVIKAKSRKRKPRSAKDTDRSDAKKPKKQAKRKLRSVEVIETDLVTEKYKNTENAQSDVKNVNKQQARKRRYVNKTVQVVRNDLSCEENIITVLPGAKRVKKQDTKKLNAASKRTDIAEGDLTIVKKYQPVGKTTRKPASPSNSSSIEELDLVSAERDQLPDQSNTKHSTKQRSQKRRLLNLSNKLENIGYCNTEKGQSDSKKVKPVKKPKSVKRTPILEEVKEELTKEVVRNIKEEVHVSEETDGKISNSIPCIEDIQQSNISLSELPKQELKTRKNTTISKKGYLQQKTAQTKVTEEKKPNVQNGSKKGKKMKAMKIIQESTIQAQISNTDDNQVSNSIVKATSDSTTSGAVLKPGNSEYSDKCLESDEAADKRTTESMQADTAMDTVNPRSAIKTGKKYVGAHTSIQGGLENAVYRAVEIGAKSFGLFLRSSRQWQSKPISEETALTFREACLVHSFPPHLIVPHGSYLVNCGSPNPEVFEKSRVAFVEDLQRCEKLGLTLFNFHPGSTCGAISVEDCIQKIAESINLAHSETKNVITVIENMSCQGHTIGGKFWELRRIIDLVHDQTRIGVCLDTCHAFAAGYDLSNESGYNTTMEDFENIVGLKYLKAIHLNDSKGKVGCHLDRHENIGKGYIGVNGFKCLMNDSRLNDIPMILETPPDLDDSKEIKLLYSMIN